MTEACPQCGGDSLRVSNVMGSTKIIHRYCSVCCYRDQIHYEGDEYVGEPKIERQNQCKRAKNIHALLPVSTAGRLNVPDVREKPREMHVGKKADCQMPLIRED